MSSPTPVDWEEKYTSLKARSVTFASEQRSARLVLEAKVSELQESSDAKEQQLQQLKEKTRTFVQEQRAKQQELEAELKALREGGGGERGAQDEGGGAAAEGDASRALRAENERLLEGGRKLKERCAQLERDKDEMQMQAARDLSSLSLQFKEEKEALEERLRTSASSSSAPNTSSSSNPSSADDAAALRAELQSNAGVKAKLLADKFSLEQRLQAVTSERDSLKASSASLSASVAGAEARAKELEGKVVGMEKDAREAGGMRERVASLERELASKTEEKRALEGVVEELRRKEGETGAELQEAREEMSELESKVKLLEGKVSATKTMLDESEGRRTEAEQSLADFEAKAKSGSADADKLRLRVKELEKKEAANVARLNDSVKREKVAQKEAEEALGAAAAADENAREKEEMVEQMKEEVKRFANLFEEEERLKKEAENEVAKNVAVTKDMKKSMKSMIEKLNAEIAGMKMERDDANQKVANLEGYSKRVKELTTEIEAEKARGNNAEARMKQLIEKDAKRDGELKKIKDENADHINKRNAAKVEISGMLKTLDAERNTVKQMNECVKYTFLPKVQTQSKHVEVTLNNLNSDLQKLKQRLNSKVQAKPKIIDDPDPNLEHGGVKKPSTLMILSKNEHLSTLDGELDKVAAGLALIVYNVETLNEIVSDESDAGCVQSVINNFGLASVAGAIASAASGAAATVSAMMAGAGGDGGGDEGGEREFQKMDDDGPEEDRLEPVRRPAAQRGARGRYAAKDDDFE